MPEEAIILPVLGVFIPIIAILGGIALALAAIKNRSKRAELEHAERMMAIEKGAPLPPAMLPPPPKQRNPYIFGFILIGFGLALMFMMLIEGDEDWGAGFLFLLPGVAILLAHSLYHRSLKAKNALPLSSLEKP